MTLLSALREDLVDRGIVRKPSVAGPASPMWLEPRVGVPAPGEGDVPVEVGQDMVLGAYLTGGISPQPYGSFLRKAIIDIRYRCSHPKLAEQAYVDITAALIDRRDFTLGGTTYIVECEEWRSLQRLGSDQQSFDYVSALIFEFHLLT